MNQHSDNFRIPVSLLHNYLLHIHVHIKGFQALLSFGCCMYQPDVKRMLRILLRHRRRLVSLILTVFHFQLVLITLMV